MDYIIEEVWGRYQMRQVSAVREWMVSWLCQLRLVWVVLATENRKKNPDILFKKTDEDYWKVGCISKGTSSSHHSSSESFCAPTHLPPAHLSLCLSFADPVFSLPLFSSLPLLAYLVIRSSVDVLVSVCSSLLSTTCRECFTQDSSLTAAEAQLVQREKCFVGNIPSTSCSVMANLLNRFIWCTVAAANIKTHLSWTIFSAK